MNNRWITPIKNSPQSMTVHQTKNLRRVSIFMTVNPEWFVDCRDW